MSEVALLSFGCAVSFVVAAAVYIYVTEDFAGAKRTRKQKGNGEGVEVKDLHEAA